MQRFAASIHRREKDLREFSPVEWKSLHHCDNIFVHPSVF